MKKEKDALSDMRVSYNRATLHKKDLKRDPLQQFEDWFAKASEHYPNEVNCMTLATVDDTGQPSTRLVLLKGLPTTGFIFFTNYKSRKAKDLANNPKAALLFFWPALEQQIRIEGTISKISEEDSTAYFQSRPRDSQVGAWASPQSAVIDSREVISRQLRVIEDQYNGVERLPRPSQWGGYMLTPHYFEFWQGRPSRLHDRFVYQKSDDQGSAWSISRLAP